MATEEQKTKAKRLLMEYDALPFLHVLKCLEANEIDETAVSLMRLFNAAPDLLEALHSAFVELQRRRRDLLHEEDHQHDLEETETVITQVRQALARAEGRRE